MINPITCQLVARTPARQASIAALSLQADGSVSFVLNDPTFISPDARGEILVFNLYNQGPGGLHPHA